MTESKTRLDPATVTIGDTGPEVVLEEMNREDLVRYAGASGDFNPVHYSEPYARKAGHRSVFAQGMLISGFASRFVTNWIGINALTSFSTRFVAQAWPGDTLKVTGEVVRVDRTSDTGASVDIQFSVRSDADQTVLTGTATGTYTDADLP